MGNRETGNNIYNKFIRNIRSGYVKLLRGMNNRKIRTKTIYLYVFCVLVPVLVTNSIIIGNAFKAVHDERIENINNIADAVAYDMSSSMENAAYVTVDLYASNSIYSFLDTQYDSDSEFVKAYNKVFENYVFYSSSKRMIDGITLYSDNPTMINGGRYYRIDGIRSEDWYQKYIKSGQDLFVYTYYTDSNYFENKRRMISVIRKLNLLGRIDIEKIVKLDLNYNRITEYINNSAFDMKVYICHGDKIVFSNDERDKGLKEDFEDISMIPMNKVQAHKSMSTYGFDYDVYLMGYKSDYSTILKDRLWLIVLLFLADALLPAGIIALFSSSITTRVLLLRKYLRKVKGEVFEPIPETEGKDEISELLDNYNLMAGRMNNLIEYEYKSKLEQQELHLARQQAELLALYSQINPHFLFNVLESIRMRSMIKGEHETSQMIESLARLMRKSAEWGADLITIEQELGFTEDYLNLQRYRFGNDFNFKYRINNKCYSYLIPSLVLVTFVENSCVHGLNKEGHSGTIYISIYEEDAFLYIEVEDTGIGMEPDKVLSLEKLLNEADINDLQKTTSLGMLNASIRLKKYCGNQVKISIESEIQVGTCVIIRIPIENVKNTYNERRAAENED